MYKIYADDVLIYDSTLEDYKIGKGEITKEVGKSGSFVFSLYPDHPFYNGFVALKTVVTVYKSGRIVFRGRVLDDKVDYWNNKVLTCEGELGFLQDSIVRPYSFQGTPADLFRQFIEGHNAQVDNFKQFKVGTVDIQDANDYVNRSSTDYSATQAMLTSALTDSGLGGYIYITHGDDGTDPVPTIHYVKDFSKTSTQTIEFGANLKDYVKTTDAADTATAIIPLGTQNSTDGGRLTIEDVNDGKDYIYSEAGVALRGWVFKTVVWDDVNLAQNLLTKARAYLDSVVKQNITVELNAIDLHLLDHSIESFNVCEYVCVRSTPHHFDEVMLCNKQTMNLLKPENDTVVLGYKTASFTGASSQMAASVSVLGKQVSSIKQDGAKVELQVKDLTTGLEQTLRVSADGVTITDANGESVTINGSQIDATTINTQDLKLTGVITWGDLDAEVQGDINNRGISASRARTIISEELVSSPNIAGGKFWDLDQNNWIEMGEVQLSSGKVTVGYFHHYCDGYSSVEPVLVMGYYNPTTAAPNWVLAPFNKIALDYLESNETMYAIGNWDFAQATVTGLDGIGGDITVTPVWG